MKNTNQLMYIKDDLNNGESFFFLSLFKTEGLISRNVFHSLNVDVPADIFRTGTR